MSLRECQKLKMKKQNRLRARFFIIPLCRLSYRFSWPQYIQNSLQVSICRRAVNYILFLILITHWVNIYWFAVNVTCS